MATRELVTPIYQQTPAVSHITTAAMITAILLALILLIAYIYHLSTRKFDYWKKKNVPYEKPTPFLGNYGRHILTEEYLGKTVQKLCKKFPNEPYIGAFFGTEPVLIPQDPEIIKLILTKDYTHFSGREVSDYYHREIITQNLFFSSGDRWKVMRQNLSPIFSISKMRNMFHLIEKCSRMLSDLIDKELEKSDIFEVTDIMTRYTMDCICSLSFGVDTNTMSDARDNPFRIMGELIFAGSRYRALKASARLIWPSIFYGIGMKNFPAEIAKFFNKLVMGIFNERQNKPSPRNDIIDVIMAMKTNGILCFRGDSIKGDKKVEMVLDDELIVATVVGLFAAGFETSATTLSLSLYELAKNEEAQDRAIAEIDSYLERTGGKITYECINELPYVEACMEETIRLYPVLSVLNREVMEDYTLPSGVKLEKGLRVHLPIYHLNHNPEFFEDPESYRPERLYGEEKARVRPYTFMPFGDGPRICIGMV